MIMYMRKISSIRCAPALSHGQVAILQLEVDNYLRLRMKCFPEEKLIPKHEYLRHYPMLIKHFGPLKHVWTLRFESEHGEFKTDIRHFTNSCNRQKKYAVTFNIEDDVEFVIKKGCEKLKCLGRKLVAEDDGTEVDDIDGLVHYSSIDKPILLLEEDEIWVPSNINLVRNGQAEQIDTTKNSDEAGPNVEIIENQQRANNDESHVDEGRINEGTIDEDPTDENRVHGNVEAQLGSTEKNVREGNAAEDNFEAILASRRAAFTSWEQYTVPWVQILTSSDLDKCRTGVEKGNTQRNVVHAIVTELIFYQVPIRRKDFRLIAIQCMNTFPDIFEDRDEYGCRIDNGYNGILQKLEDHFNYLKRVPKKRPGLSQHLNLKLKHRRTLQSVQSGTVNWQPENIPANETEETLENKRIILKNYDFMDLELVENGSDIEKLLSDTYPEQRLFLNDIYAPPMLEMIMDKWPFLFTPPCLFWHFQKFTGVSIQKFDENFHEKVQKILIFGKWKHHFQGLEALTEEGKHEKMLEVMQIRFAETEAYLLHTCSPGVDVETLRSDSSCPCIAVQDIEPTGENEENERLENENTPKDSESDARNRRKYLLFFDKRVVLQCDTLQKALKLLLVVYFVFNKTYPKAQGTTLLFLQMFFLNISSPGTTFRARQDSFKRKAINFMRALKKLI